MTKHDLQLDSIDEQIDIKLHKYRAHLLTDVISSAEMQIISNYQALQIISLVEKNLEYLDEDNT